MEKINKKIAQEAKKIRSKHMQKRKGETKVFYYQDPLDQKGTIGNALEIIFATTGCRWALSGGCTFCGYAYQTKGKGNTLKEFQETWEKNLDKKGPIAAKLYTSGSFFDDKEIPQKQREKIFQTLSKDPRVVETVVESRPEHISKEKITSLKKILGQKKLSIGIGLETTNDQIRVNSINKGFLYQDYLKAREKIKKSGAKTRTYLFVKPIFLTEKEALKDALESFEKIKKNSDTVAFNFCYVWKNTLLDKLFSKKNYSPPWLWTVEEILKKTLGKGPRILITLMGAGKHRGPSNCQNCSEKVAQEIRESVLKQKPLFKTRCECEKKWRDQLALELV